MAVTRTPRFSLHRWDSGADSFNREQNDSDNRQLEALGAIFRSGLDAGKGDPTDSSFVRSFYHATDTDMLYFCNGTVWVTLNSYSTGSDISDLPVGTANDPGAVTTSATVKTINYALADHTHAVPDSATPVAIGTALSEGSASTVALSDHVHEIGSGAIDTSTMFTSGVVNAAAIGSGAVTEAKIGSAAVTEAKIGSSAVTEAKIATDAVTPLKIASTLAGDGLGRNVSTGVLSVNVDSTTIETNSDTLRIKDSGVTAAKIGTGAVTETKIGSNAVTTAKIADANVTGSKLSASVAGSGLNQNVSGNLDVNVDSSTIEISTDILRIKDLGVTAAKLAADSVTTAKILNSNITTAKIADGNVTAVKLDSDVAGTGLTSTSGVLSVNVDNSTVELSSGNLQIKNAGVVEAKIATGAVTAGKIGSSAVTTAKIADANVTAVKLASDVAGTGLTSTSGVLSVNVDDSTIEHDGSGNLAIVNGGVDTTQIANDAVDYTKIDTGIYYNATSLGAGGAIKYSTGTPTGGTAGDIWLQYV